MNKEIDYREKIERCLFIKERMVKYDMYRNWRISPLPFSITRDELSYLDSLGQYFYMFYKGSNKLYFESLHGRQPAWIYKYLDQGKPQSLIEYSRMNRMKGLLPGIIRPDLILTESGMIATELDSVPGGIGITGSLQEIYTSPMDISNYKEGQGRGIIGGPYGMMKGFVGMTRSLSGLSNPVLAIIVSEESEAYRPEMKWLAEAIRREGGIAYTIRPEELVFTEEGLWIEKGTGKVDMEKVDVVYRFFELFDLKNIPKAELVMYSAKKRKVLVTPPFKPFLEEKLLYALFHHPLLKEFWINELGEEAYNSLFQIIPRTWVLDPSPMPPYGIIPGLKLGKRQVASWKDLASATQKERAFVIKPSGFSELAWGSHGVIVGHDISQEKWKHAIEKALQEFYHTPYILQEYHRGRHVEVEYMDEGKMDIVKMVGRVRLCPYYFVQDDNVILGGIMATICALEKKLIHGMEEAVITVCSSH